MTALLHIGAAAAVGLAMYYGIGLGFELVYYRRRRKQADAWKCQPQRFLTEKMWRHQVLLGTANLIVSSVASGLGSYFVATGGKTAIYFDWRAHGLFFTVATTILYFFTIDLGLYLAHRAFHTPALFRAIHRWHHRYTSPTAFAALAMHPVELATYQSVALLPLLLLPVHVAGVIAVLVYQNYVALIDHSGVESHPWAPYRAPTRFHDDHHVYFHVNYGQNLGIWDRLFGTHRREDRLYGPEIFGGCGTPLPGAQASVRPRYVDYRKGA